MKEDANLEVVQVSSENSEYSGVIDIFQGNVGGKQVVKVWILLI